MEALTVNYLPFAKLRPDPRNSNQHDPDQVAQIAASIKRFGFLNPILIDETRTIVAGEGRYLAAKLLATEEGYRKKVPTITLKGLSEIQRRAFLIADNQIARNSTWDLDKLAVELADLNYAKYDLTTELGFNLDYLADILKDTPSDPEVVAVAGHTRTTHRDPAKKEGKGKMRQLAVLVLCADAETQEEVFNQLTAQGFECQNTVV